MFKVFKVQELVEDKLEDRWQVFWCPSAPMHYQDKIPHDGRLYKQRQAAYRRKRELQAKVDKKRAEAA